VGTTIHPPPAASPPHGAGGSTGGAHGRSVRDRAGSASGTGVWVGIAAISMSFAALTSALIVGQSSAAIWRHVALPSILYLNTFILLTSSVTLEISRRRFRRFVAREVNDSAAVLRALCGTLVLGLLFVAGQWMARMDLRSQGLYLATNSGCSFLYLFTVLHAVHVLGGVAGLFYVIRRLNGARLRRSTLDAASRYWHFVDVLWVYLLLLLWAKL
jgi:cytochrome c oxidase subunit 3